jgi:hypothetical protein
MKLNAIAADAKSLKVFFFAREAWIVHGSVPEKLVKSLGFGVIRSC